MGFRFRRRFKILPGVHLNLSRSWPSISLGPRGLHYTIGSKGTRTTVGVPGSGVSWTKYRSYSSRTNSALPDRPPPLESGIKRAAEELKADPAEIAEAPRSGVLEAAAIEFWRGAGGNVSGLIMALLGLAMIGGVGWFLYKVAPMFGFAWFGWWAWKAYKEYRRRPN